MAPWMSSYLPVNGQPYTPPASLIRGLYNLRSGRLRLRWSHAAERWCVEIKINRAREDTEFTLGNHYKTRDDGAIVEHDSWIRYRDGYWLLGYWTAYPMLGDWCLDEMRRNDMERLGGAKTIGQMLDDRDAKLAEQRAKATSDENQAIGRQIYRDMQTQQGERGYVSRNATGLGVY